MISRKRNSNMRRYICLLFACFTLSFLAGCGEETATEPGTGVYEAKYASMMGIDMDISEIFDDGFKLDLRDNGKGRVYFDGDDAGFKWTLDGTDFSGKGGGAEISGTMKDGVIELPNFMDTGIDLTLICDDVAGGSSSDGSDKNTAEADVTKTTTLLNRLRSVKNGEQVYDTGDNSAETEDTDASESGLADGAETGSEETSEETPEGDTSDIEDYTSEDEYGASFAGDWEGMTFIYDSSGTTKTEKMGKTGIKADSVYGTFARIWFDDDGQVKMDMVCIVDLPEMNYRIDDATYDEAADTIYCDGKLLGGEFSTAISAPGPDGVLTFSGRTNGDIKSNYVIYLKRLDSEWDRNDASMISDKEYNIYITNNLPNLEGMTLEERVDKYKETGVEVDMSGFLEPKP